MRVTSWRNHVAYVNYVMARRYLEESLVEPVRLVTGRDVMETLGIGPGPEVGRLLRAIEEAQGAGEIHTREEALALIRRLGGVPVRKVGAREVPLASRRSRASDGG
jgi:hypothetical protein